LQFYFAGDIVGFEALQMKRYPYSVSALAETIVCEISFEALLEATRDYPFLQQQLFILMSQRINRGALALGLQAERKLAYFLLEMFNRLSASSPYPTVVLPMSRQDIANHLGLAAETITRLLNNFVQADVIKTHKREICFNNIDKLKSISAGAIKEDKTKLS
jgi:CRP/FNR family transcriptional regulator